MNNQRKRREEKNEQKIDSSMYPSGVLPDTKLHEAKKNREMVNDGTHFILTHTQISTTKTNGNEKKKRTRRQNSL